MWALIFKISPYLQKMGSKAHLLPPACKANNSCHFCNKGPLGPYLQKMSRCYFLILKKWPYSGHAFQAPRRLSAKNAPMCICCRLPARPYLQKNGRNEQPILLQIILIWKKWTVTTGHLFLILKKWGHVATLFQAPRRLILKKCTLRCIAFKHQHTTMHM